jgi:hypothetical protein
MAVNSPTVVRKLISLPRALLQGTDDYQLVIRTQSEAIRPFVKLGLAAAQEPEKADGGI